MWKWLVLPVVVGLAACAAPPKGTVKPRSQPAETSTPPKPATPSRPTPAVVTIAQGYLGTPYRYGGSSREGIDCSGLVVRVFSQVGVSMPRTSTSQFRTGESILKSELVPGDLVFFGNKDGRITHVGIYTGAGRFIHASSSKRKVRYDSLKSSYFQARYIGARRIMDAAR